MASTPLIDDGVAPVAAAPKYSISQQDVDIDIDFAQRCIRGTTRIVVEPLERDLRELKFSCRQMIIKRVKVDRYPVYNYEYDDPYKSLTIRDEYTVHQHHWMKDNVMNGFTHKADPDLRIPMPPKMRVQSEGRVLLRLGSSLSLANSVPTPVSATADDGSSNFKKFTVEIQYEMRNVRDGLHWVGLEDGDHRYPHVYTYSNSLVHTLANYVFPCVDQADKKFLWRVSITCPRTLGDIYAPSALSKKTQENEAIKNGEKKGMFNGGQVQAVQDVKNINSPFSEAEKGLEMQVVCSGYMEDADAPTEDNDRRRKWIFSCATPVLPRHIGFSIGPFEEVDLSQYRESGQDDKMGMSAVSVHGFCLPGRSDELRNTCMPLASALDKLSTQFVFYPFESESSSYKVAFVDDLPMNVVDTATLSICSSRLLVQDDIIDPLHESTRELVHAVASQWLGVKITPQAQDDNWLIVGGSYFMADWFMTTLWGRNEHRFRLKVAADKVHELDVNRPSLIYLGGAIEVDPDEYEFLKLKAPLVLSILHHRILKANGRIGVNRALSRVLFDDQNGKLENSILDTSQFQRACEKVSHGRLDSFFNQWVYGRGCPTFRITQRFNKKKLVVEMLIVQVQAEEQVMGGTTSESFMREAKESVEEVEKGNIPLLFTGPMTMRIHEADGTPYEHIVDIKELTTKVEIPYNTKYKRLKRNRRAKERAAAAAGVDISGEPQDDALLYCLGDVLQSEEEIREWDLADWSKEDDDKMNNEHFEWIRLDKDFEWIAKISFNQPHYMWVSQLQQDNDVIAQTESLQYLLTQQPFKLVSTILIRTLIDTRYFYGIRVIAAHALARCGTAELDWIGLKHLQKAFREFYCLEKSNMTRSNDFSDLRNYRIQCAIPEAIAMIRDSSGRAPDQVKKFFLDCLKYNDNSNNEYSDSFYISTLMSGLAQALVAVGSQAKPTRVSDDDLMAMTDEEQQNIMDQEESRSKQQLLDVEFQRSALEEIQRFRRIDEWIPSFQNQYTTTTLEGVKNLMLNKLMPKRLKDFLYYTRPQNSAYVRSKAFDCLIDLGAFEEPSVMSYFIVSFFEESSPYFRCRLWKVIGRGFAEIALKEKTEVIVQSDPMFGLVLESTEKVNKDRRLAFARTQTIAGIISVLKERVGGLQELEDVLLEAIKSPKVGIEHFLDLLTLCKILYDEKKALTVKLKLPPFWAVKHTGRGKVTFKSKGRYRSKPYTKLDDRWKRPIPPPPPPPPPPVLKRDADTELQPPSEKRQRLSVEPVPASVLVKLPPSVPTPKFVAPVPPVVSAPPVPAVPPPRPAEPRKIITLSLKQKSSIPSTPKPSLVPPTPSKRKATPTPGHGGAKKKKSKIVRLSLPSNKLRKFPSGLGGSSFVLPMASSRASSPSTLSVASNASSVDMPLAQRKPIKPPPLKIPLPSAAVVSKAPQSATTPAATPGGSGFKLKLTFGKKGS